MCWRWGLGSGGGEGRHCPRCPVLRGVLTYDLAESRKSWGPWATWEELSGAVRFVASRGLSQCSWVAVHFSCTSALNSPAYCLLNNEEVRNLFSSLPKRAPCVIGRSWGKYVCVSLIECGRVCVWVCVCWMLVCRYIANIHVSYSNWDKSANKDHFKKW